MSTTEAKPKFTFNLPVPGGQIQAAIWENERESGDESFTSVSVTISRRYYDNDEKQWKTAKSFRECDLLTLAFAAEKLYDHLTSKKEKA